MPIALGAAVVFALTAAALLLFVTEAIPSDITAIGVLVALAVLEPLTGVSAQEAISGFASPATLTIVAMYILSAGVQKTGIVDRLGYHLARLTKGVEQRLLFATIGTTGLSAALVNNTPIVAVFIPMITGLADRSDVSPSKLLLPLSYAAMLGGSLTLIGTSTNILASDLSARLLDHPISMFEFTPVGLLVFLVGAAYLLTAGRRLTPARVKPEHDLTQEFALQEHLVHLEVPEESPLVEKSVGAAEESWEAGELEVDLLQLVRGEDTFVAPSVDRTIRIGDVLTVRTVPEHLRRLVEEYGVHRARKPVVTEEHLGEPMDAVLVEAVVTKESRFVGGTVPETGLEDAFDTTVLAVKRGDELVRRGLRELEVRPGDTLLLHTTREVALYLHDAGDVFVTEGLQVPEEDHGPKPLSPRTPIALGVMAAVVLVAALGVQPIVISALGGVFAMVVTGCLTPTEAYDSVSWNVIFLLAGILPLGVAMQNTGGDAMIAELLVSTANVLPPIAVMGLFYVLTGLLANVITPVASVVLMIPIAIDTATRIDANAFSFLLTVMFASGTAFMTPIGYQTNLMVYGPGGYRFTDYLRVGAPLQAILSVVTTLGIAAYFGI